MMRPLRALETSYLNACRDLVEETALPGRYDVTE